jgi:hypothetical protein
MSQVVPPSFLFQYALPMVRADQLPGAAGSPLRLPSSATVFLPARLNSAEDSVVSEGGMEHGGAGI